jgi:hypothetical protein
MMCGDPLRGPGDIVNITGIFLPKPFTGFKVKLVKLALPSSECENETFADAVFFRLCKRD